jgi:hypothetical protein
VRRLGLQFLAGAIGGGAVTVVVLRWVRLPRTDMDPVHVAAVLAALPACYYAAIALHEIGHLAAGRLAGFRPWLLVVGPLKLQRTGRSWSAGVNRVFPWHGGFAGGTPDGTHRLRQRMTLLLAGGAGTNLLTGAAALALLTVVDVPRAGGRLVGWDAAIYLGVLAFALISCLMAVIALVPGTGHGFVTDGGRIVRFLKNDAGTEGEVALLAVLGASTSGVRPRDWPRDLVARALTLPADTPTGVAAEMLAHDFAVDTGDIAAARQHLAAAMARIDTLPRLARPGLLLMAAQFAALHDQDARRARALLETARPLQSLDAYKLPLVDAVVTSLEESGPIVELLDRAERELSNAMDQGGAKVDLDLIAHLRNRT